MSEQKGHPAAPMLWELAEVAEWHPEPWREFEWRVGDGDDWKECDSLTDVTHATEEYEARRRIRTKRIGRFEVPLPVREPLNRGQIFYVADPTLPNGTGGECEWGVGLLGPQSYWLKHGLIHLDSESAAIHGRALASLMQEDEG